MKYLSFIFISFLFIGCQDTKDTHKVFFGGEIINPKSDVVLLMQHEIVIDSLSLNKDNTFGKYIPNLTSGLYYFKHGYEFQYLYLEPKDSISIRLNTWDFDETLVFDGIGSDKNELLLDLFLINEKEVDNFYTYFSLDEANFESKVNDALERHSSYLEQLKEANNSLSNDFLHLARAAIDYPIYRLKELYPFYHKKSLPKDSIFEVSEAYYDYRQNVDLNDSLLSGYYGYQNYVSAHLYNLAFQKSETHKFDANFRAILLALITEKVHLPELKNRLVYQEVINMLFNGSCQVDQNQLKLFYANSTDSIALKNIKSIIKAKENLKLGSQFNDFSVISTDKKVISIKEVISKKKTVMYFLSPSIESNNYLNKRIHFLSNKYPNLIFVGIHKQQHVQETQDVKYPLNQQYFITDENYDTDFFSTNYPRAILIDNNGIVVNNYTLLTNKYVERQLDSFITE